jgi:DNA uptake protein ComE-like DNA-binding protein
MVLIIVLVVVVALSLAALTFAMLMVRNREVVQLTGRRVQAVALAESGIEAARAYLMEYPNIQYSDGGWYDNADQFKGILVVEDDMPSERGRFALVAPIGGDEQSSFRFGLECESAKLNLNLLLNSGDKQARDRLMELPGMTEEIADAILDWIDADDEPREFGAEASYYAALDSPYCPTNGPIRNLEELLLVRGVTAWHLYGADQNQNAVVGSDESFPTDMPELETTDDSLNRGWASYLTLVSRETVVNPEGEAKIDLNQDDAEKLYEELEEAFGEEWAKFIIAYRQQEQLYTAEEEGAEDAEEAEGDDKSKENSEGNSESEESIGGGSSKSKSGGASGGSSNNASGAANPAGQGNQGDQQGGEKTITIEYADRVSGDLDMTKALSQKLESVLDLVGASIKVKYKDQEDTEVIVSPLFKDTPEAMRDDLTKLQDYATVGTDKVIAGRINVNLAPAPVLASIPGIETEVADQIVAQRALDPSMPEDYQRHPTWILVDGLVKLDEMKKLLPHLTAGGSVFRVQSVGFYDEGGTGVRLQAILDASVSPPRMLSLKNLIPLGRGFDPVDLGAETPATP